MDLKELVIYEKVLPKREAVYSEFPHGLSSEITTYLEKQGIKKLYCHQAEMFELAQERKNVVITTSTASGKTLSFLLPVIQEILKDPLTRAVFIYPTKALASDQYRAILPYLEYFGEDRISAGVYDGDTPVNERSRIRKTANIILTNPEMLNGAFLPNHSKYGFDFIFANLKYVVIDELHTYRGAFGSHLANVFRRLERICRYYHASPQFLCSSATIANPVELAQGICGKSFVRVEKDGSPAAKRDYLLVQPPKIMGADKNYYGQAAVETVAAELLPAFVTAQRSFIAFAKSRRSVEIVLKEARDRLESDSFFGSSLSDQISGYRGGYTPKERKEIETKMINGNLTGLVSTNALELGIDIGSVGSTVLIGYPQTRASFWQQTGRAGRTKKECTNLMILDYTPIDQYIALEPDWLFENSAENAVIDKNNLLIELAHIRAAAAEIPLTLDDIALFPDMGEIIPVLLNVQELTNQNGRFAWAGGEFPAGDFSMRNIDKNRYKLINQDNGREITEMDESQAFRELHNGAVYMHDGDSYQVTNLDLESKTAYARPFEGNYYTMPGGETNIKVIHESKSGDCYRIKRHFGDVNVSDYVYMYKKLQFHNHQNLGYEQLKEPLTKNYDTESMWMELPGDVVRTYRSLLQPNDAGQMVRNNHFNGMCFALMNAARMVTMTEQDDIGVTTSTNATELAPDTSDQVSIYIYDKYVGGLGFSDKIYDLLDPVIDQAIRMVSGCKCQDGCAACVGDYKLDKSMVVWGLTSLKEELQAPVSTKNPTYAKSTYRKKQFQLATLPDHWKEFCVSARENGDSYAAFLETVSGVEVEGSKLILIVANEFYRQWVMEDSNRQSIINIISYYCEVPQGFMLKVVSKENYTVDLAMRDKIKRRYDTLG